MRWLRVAALSALAALPARALDVQPVSVSVPAGPAHAELWLDNPAATPWIGQARLYRWEQQGDQERLLADEALAVSPARLRLGPGQRQRLRVVRLGPAPATAEQGYRLVISPAPGPGMDRTRFSLPVFLVPDAPAAPSSRLRVELAGSTSAPLLRLYNDGDGHAHLADLVFVDAQGRRQTLIDGLAGYVLPRSARGWPLPARPGGYAGGRFRARLDHAAEADLPAATGNIAVRAPSGL
ncbi:hypothetical protein D3C87_561860 [compost metagenome]